MANLTSLPTIAEDYKVQLDHNNEQATQLFSLLFPDLEYNLLFETVNIVSYLQQTLVNPALLPRVIRGIHNIMIGTGKGQVIVHVQGATTNVSVRETDEELNTKM